MFWSCATLKRRKPRRCRCQFRRACALCRLNLLLEAGVILDDVHVEKHQKNPCKHVNKIQAIREISVLAPASRDRSRKMENKYSCFDPVYGSAPGEPDVPEVLNEGDEEIGVQVELKQRRCDPAQGTQSAIGKGACQQHVGARDRSSTQSLRSQAERAGVPASQPKPSYIYINILYLYHDLFPNCIHLYPVIFP